MRVQPKEQYAQIHEFWLHIDLHDGFHDAQLEHELQLEYVRDVDRWQLDGDNLRANLHAIDHHHDHNDLHASVHHHGIHIHDGQLKHGELVHVHNGVLRRQCRLSHVLQ